MKTLNGYKKIKDWLVRDDLELDKKWWHRFFKILFILSIITLVIYMATLLINSYSRIVNQWDYVNTLTAKLNSSDYSGSVVSMKELYGEQEIISDSNVYTNNYFPSLENKDLLLPISPIFLENVESFCSDKLDRQIKEIVSKNEINLFSTTNPSFDKLSNNIEEFNNYVGINDINCVMIDSFSFENKDEVIVNYTFLRPVDIHDYVIYKYKNNFVGFIFNILISVIGVLLYIGSILFIYNKIILYIIYGNKKQRS